MERDLHSAPVALIGAFALLLVQAQGSGAAAARLSHRSDALASENCQIVKAKKRVRRWAWVPKVRRVHGHRIVIRRHGKVVYVHVRVWRTRTMVRVVCGSAPALAVPPAPQSALVPPPLLVAEPVAAPSESGSPPQRPSNTAAPTIFGTAQQGQLLTASQGAWSGSPSSYSYQWLRCDFAGASCAPLALATTSSYSVVEADVGHTLRVVVIASNAAGSSAPATSPATEPVVAALQPPVNKTPPAISGMAQQGQLLAHSDGSWLNEPTSETDQWFRCDVSGSNCRSIPEATNETYMPVEADVGHTLRVQEVASNAAGSSAPASSAHTEVVTAEPQAPTNTSPPTIAGTAQQGQTLTASPGSWTGSPTVYSYEWKRCGAAGGSCVPIPLATGPTYLLTEADVGRTLRVAVVASNAAGSSAPASSAHTEVVTAEPQAPTNTGPPTIAGTAQQGQKLTASPGRRTGSPTVYSYERKRCGAAGGSCKTIERAPAPTYLLPEADVGRTLRVAVVASNSAGSSEPATSTPTPVVTGNGAVQHLEYVVQDGTTSVYDIDHEFTLVKTISLPLTSDEVRGVSVAPSTHTMYIMHGGDGPMNGSGNGSVLAYDLVSEKVIWNVELSTGIDSGQVSSDGEKLYIPTGENTSSGIWNVLSTANGEVIGTIQGPSGAHNTVASNDGRYVYLGGRASNVLDAYETATAAVRSIGPLIGTERPFTVNGSNTLAFTTATNFDGCQISSVTTGNVLFTVSLGEIPIGFPFTTASHGIALSPDERQVYVTDAVNKVVQFWDVSRVKEGVAPTQIGVVPVAGLSGNENACVYDCGRGGWLQLSLDGRYLFVGDSGEVIDTATREVITTLATLAQTKKSIEVDWQNGVPIATSGRTGVGYVP